MTKRHIGRRDDSGWLNHPTTTIGQGTRGWAGRRELQSMRRSRVILRAAAIDWILPWQRGVALLPPLQRQQISGQARLGSSWSISTSSSAPRLRRRALSLGIYSRAVLPLQNVIHV